MKKITTTVLTKKGNVFEVSVPSERIVCYDCHGDGTELGHGLKGVSFSSEEMNDDPDFSESYFSGEFDQPCSTCNGLRVLDVVDEKQMTKKMLERYWRRIERDRREEADERAEQRHFARACGEWD